MDILQGNKLIKEFIKNNEPVSYLRGFHYNWSALMPVIKNFMDKWESALGSDMAKDIFAQFDSHRINIDNAVCTYDISESFKVFTEALQWYNTQSKQPENKKVYEISKRVLERKV